VLKKSAVTCHYVTRLRLVRSSAEKVLLYASAALFYIDAFFNIPLTGLSVRVISDQQ
jgi:hypothetical protein